MLSEDDFAFLNHGRADGEWVPPSGLTLEQMENKAIAATLQQTHGNINEAASNLGVDRSTLYDRIKKYNLPRFAE